MNLWSFFDKKYCLTMGGNEWIQADAEFKHVGLNDVIRFDSLPHELGPHQSFNQSVYAILQDFYDSGEHRVLFMEDDVDFRRLDLLEAVLQQVPKDYDVFYLGCNIQDDKPERVSQYIWKIKGAFTTHSVSFNRQAVKFILDHHPGLSDQMADNWLSGQHHLKQYACVPMLAYQRPRVSSIWGEMVDYTGVFQESEKKCR
jgi:hypothetical protein